MSEWIMYPFPVMDRFYFEKDMKRLNHA